MATFAKLLFDGSTTDIEILGQPTESQFNEDKDPDKHEFNVNARLLSNSYKIRSKSVEQGEEFVLVMSSKLKDALSGMFTNGNKLRIWNQGGWQYVDCADQYAGNTANKEAVDYVDTKQGNKPIDMAQASSMTYNNNEPSVAKNEEEKWRMIAEGKVRHGFALEAFRMNWELNDKNKKIIEDWTDYVMIQRLPNEPPEVVIEEEVDPDLPF